MRVKKIFWLFLLHLELFVLGSLFFILLFQTPLFKGTGVFFYRGLILLLAASLATILIAIAVRAVTLGKMFSFYDVILSCLLVFSLNLVFFTHIPVTADRSLSVFMLGYMNKYSEGALSQKEIAEAFSQKYIRDYGAVNKRLEEQIASGNVAKEATGYRITNQGKLLIRVYSFFSDLFGINKRNIFP
jgi:hypothetical protein